MPEIRIGGLDVGTPVTLEAGKVYNVTETDAAQLVKDGVASYCHDEDAKKVEAAQKAKDEEAAAAEQAAKDAEAAEKVRTEEEEALAAANAGNGESSGEGSAEGTEENKGEGNAPQT